MDIKAATVVSDLQWFGMESNPSKSIPISKYEIDNTRSEVRNCVYKCYMWPKLSLIAVRYHENGIK